jgi:alpha-D-ribose 1-methylphosphonate 5-triphosphate diphosphatase PhnM
MRISTRCRGVVDIPCSDYYTPSMLHAVFGLARNSIMSRPKAMRMVSFNS